MDIEEKMLVKNVVYEGRIITVRNDTALLPDGKTAYREVVEHPGGVSVVPLTDDNHILLVEQFRYPYMKPTLEIPAGKRDKGGEDPLICGIRELGEETGCTADEFIFLGELYPTPGYSDEIIYMYAAKGLHYGDSHTDEDEFLNIKRIEFDKAVEMILCGEIKDAKTQAAILKVKVLKDRGAL